MSDQTGWQGGYMDEAIHAAPERMSEAQFDAYMQDIEDSQIAACLGEAAKADMIIARAAWAEINSASALARRQEREKLVDLIDEALLRDAKRPRNGRSVALHLTLWQANSLMELVLSVMHDCRDAEVQAFREKLEV